MRKHWTEKSNSKDWNICIRDPNDAYERQELYEIPKVNNAYLQRYVIVCLKSKSISSTLTTSPVHVSTQRSIYDVNPNVADRSRSINAFQPTSLTSTLFRSSDSLLMLCHFNPILLALQFRFIRARTIFTTSTSSTATFTIGVRTSRLHQRLDFIHGYWTTSTTRPTFARPAILSTGTISPLVATKLNAICFRWCRRHYWKSCM